METIQAIRSRRSIRKYQPKPVPHEVIEQIVAISVASLIIHAIIVWRRGRKQRNAQGCDRT